MTSFPIPQIHSNGLVSFGTWFWASYVPSSWSQLSNWYDIQGLAVLAPLWTESDYNHQDSKVLYQQYDSAQRYGSQDRTQTDAMLSRASEDAVAYGGFSSFKATWVLVVTWVNMHPRQWRSPVDKVRDFIHG